MLKDNIFRAYDIRGVYPDDINQETAYLIGSAFGSYVQDINVNEVIIGYDNRLSSIPIKEKLVEGIINSGVNVIELGLITTPMFYYARIHLNNYAGIMVTASHNPKEYNGLKISFNNLGNALGDEIIAFREYIKKGIFKKGKGIVKTYSIKEQYVNNLLSALTIGNKKIKIVFDCGNGTGSIVIKDILDRLPIEYYLLYCTSDGTFPNHHPDPSVNENLVDLCNKVVELNYDIGIAIDADGDRVRIVDNLGRIIDTDILMAIIYKQINDKLSVRKALFDVKCSKALIDVLDKLNIEKIMWRTGNSYTYRKFHEENLDFGGEYSGHLFFGSPYVGIDDGIYGGLRMVEILSNSNMSLAKYNDDIPKYVSSPETFYYTTEENKFKLVEELKKYVIDKQYKYIDIDGVRVLFDDGWALIRSSNTGPKLTVRFEANSIERMNIIQEEIMDQLDKINKELGN